MCHGAHLAHSLDLSHPPAPDPEDPALDILPTLYEFHAHEINKHAPDYQSLPYVQMGYQADFWSDNSVCSISHEHPP